MNKKLKVLKRYPLWSMENAQLLSNAMDKHRHCPSCGCRKPCYMLRNCRFGHRLSLFGVTTSQAQAWSAVTPAGKHLF